MRLTHMTERIEFYSLVEGKTPEGVPTLIESDTPEYSCWAELLNTPMREFKDPTTKVGFRRESPNFAIKFEVNIHIDSMWRVKWRGKFYEITGLDPDFDKRNVTKLECKAVE
ncbi:head-tail adaptor protein [Companilactobacillus mishanensis]|uniref:Head-tail adaptor protein n=1 Tax=Companilactobacillus mishanensis TaxID=2486008 RepID=A0A5P0ZGM8_9LACO|nr:head-tail adaptor protein [Companilactobacillus mishanensis]MQS52169.1 head-tail adaptor protein [Companilactobacillus mishanensis]